MFDDKIDDQFGQPNPNLEVPFYNTTQLTETQNDLKNIISNMGHILMEGEYIYCLILCTHTNLVNLIINYV